jgi:hypothetical protein
MRFQSASSKDLSQSRTGCLPASEVKNMAGIFLSDIHPIETVSKMVRYVNSGYFLTIAQETFSK